MGKKRIHELHPLFCLADPLWSSPLLPKKKKISYIILIHRKLWLGCFDLQHLDVLGESLVFPPALPGAPVLGGDFLRAGGGAGAEDAAATAAPGGADSAGEGGAAAAAGPWRVARSRPPGRKLLASAGAAGAPSPGGRGSPYGLLAPTSLRRQEAPVSSRRRLLRDSPRRAREPPCPPSALSWRSGPSAAAEGLPRRTQGLRGRALSSSAPAGWLCLRRLSPARRADRARRPAGSAGAARGQDPPCAERTS